MSSRDYRAPRFGDERHREIVRFVTSFSTAIDAKSVDAFYDVWDEAPDWVRFGGLVMAVANWRGAMDHAKREGVGVGFDEFIQGIALGASE